MATTRKGDCDMEAAFIKKGAVLELREPCVATLPDLSRTILRPGAAVTVTDTTHRPLYQVKTIMGLKARVYASQLRSPKN